MKKIVQYGKSYENIYEIKEYFYQDNQKLLASQIAVNKKYAEQLLRRSCKNCNKNSLKKSFKSFFVEYYVCENCSHLNGKYQDSKKFIKYLYQSGGGNNYSSGYTSNFDKRVKNIYVPKVNFLKKVIKENINLIDIGSGGGHFLKALEEKKIKAEGVEISKILTHLANAQLKKNKVTLIKEHELCNIINREGFNVMSLIAVLEHLENPDLILKSFIESNIKYLYISVPLFSLSVFLENSFKNVYPRHLAAGHTHLYTEQSLNYLAKKYNLKIIGEWWFGTDFPDLHRSLAISGSYLNKKNYLNELNKKFYSAINQLQLTLDKKKLSSEVHMIFQKK